MILIAHARIADEMVTAAEHVLGKQPLLASLNVVDSDKPDQLQDELSRLIRQTDTGNGVLVLADMFGGTPCNVALSCAEPGRIEVLSGFNLPALIKALSLRTQSDNVKEIASEVLQSAQQYICLSSSYLEKRSEGNGHA